MSDESSGLEVFLHGMRLKRYDFLMDGTGPCVRLTEEEMKEGWHWCQSWDLLLVHPDMHEFNFCQCNDMEKFRTEERKEKYKKSLEQRSKALDRLVKLDEELGLL